MAAPSAEETAPNAQNAQAAFICIPAITTDITPPASTALLRTPTFSQLPQEETPAFATTAPTRTPTALNATALR